MSALNRWGWFGCFRKPGYLILGSLWPGSYWYYIRVPYLRKLPFGFQVGAANLRPLLSNPTYPEYRSLLLASFLTFKGDPLFLNLTTARLEKYTLRLEMLLILASGTGLSSNPSSTIFAEENCYLWSSRSVQSCLPLAAVSWERVHCWDLGLQAPMSELDFGLLETSF